MAVIMAITGVILYAVFNVLLEQKIKGASLPIIIMLYSITPIALSLVWLIADKAGGKPIVLPQGLGGWTLVLVAGAIIFLADSLYIGAYKAGGSLATVSTIAMLMPIFSLIIVNVFFQKTSVNIWQVVSYIFLAAGSIMAIKGSSIIT